MNTGSGIVLGCVFIGHWIVLFAALALKPTFLLRPSRIIPWTVTMAASRLTIWLLFER